MRVTAVIMAAVMIAAIAAGCNREEDDPNAPEVPDFIYVPDFITLPDGIDDIQNLIYADGKFYFTSWISGMDDDGNYFYRTTLNTMNMDGTGLRELENYSSGEPPVEDAMGNMWINALRVDGHGNLWVAETGNYYISNLPEDYDPEIHGYDTWRYHEDLGNVMTVRKLDDKGGEVFSVDISSLASGSDYFYLQTFNIDKDDNIYIGASDVIYVLDSDGRLQFKLDNQSWVDQLLTLPDGSVAYFGWMETGRALRPINFNARAWGESIDMPHNAYNVFPGGGDYSIVFSDNVNLYGIETETNEVVKLLNWINSDIMLDGMESLTILPDGRIMCVNRSYSRSMTDYSVTFELIILTQVPYESVPQRTILTMATLYLDWNLRSAIVNFNKTNDTYRINVNDYSEFNTQDDWQAGLTKLSTEIISGRIPDLMDVQQLPFKQYVAKGLLVDLYPYIDSDPRYNRTDFMENVLRASELDGALYQLFPTFNITTLAGNPAVLGPGMGWNMDEFRAVLRDNPQADMPMGQWNTKINFLSQAIFLGMDKYVDWANGKCDFDNDDFAGLLEFANTFPDEFNYDYDNYIEEHELIAMGRQIMSMMYIYDFRSVMMQRAMYGGDLVFKGFPTDNRQGNSINISGGLAMTSKCIDKEGAWQFMRTILAEDWQRNNVWGFPTNKNVFYEKLEEATTPQYYTDWEGNEVEIKHSMGWGDGFMIEYGAMSQEEADQIMELINSVTGTSSQDQVLSDIISEDATEFFNGRRTAREAARIIQSRASIYIAEQS